MFLFCIVIIFFFSDFIIYIMYKFYSHCTCKQYLMTERALTQWKKYMAMLHNAKAASNVSVSGPHCNHQSISSESGIFITI